MTKFLTALSVLWLTATGCSGDAAAPSEKTRAQFCVDWATAACSAETVSVCQSTNSEACRQTQQGFCQNLVPTEGFSAQNAEACLSAVSAAYADADLTAVELKTVFRLGKPCDKLVRGPRTVGESCSSNLDCNAPGGLACVIKGSSPEGTCQTPKVKLPGLSCAAAEEICSDGFYCNSENCVEGKAVGGTCANQAECGPAGFCGATSECTARLAVASVCSQDYECVSDVCYQLGDGSRSCLDRLRLSPSEPACDNLR